MNEPLTVAPKHGFVSFHNFPICRNMDDLKADFAILGVPYGFAYTIDEVSNDQTNAPTHIRQYCERALRGLDRWDFDIGGPLLADQPIRIVDCGDILGDLRDPAVHNRRTEEAVRKILAAGAIPTGWRSQCTYSNLSSLCGKETYRALSLNQPTNVHKARGAIGVVSRSSS